MFAFTDNNRPVIAKFLKNTPHSTVLVHDSGFFASADVSIAYGDRPTHANWYPVRDILRIVQDHLCAGFVTGENLTPVMNSGVELENVRPYSTGEVVSPVTFGEPTFTMDFSAFSMADTAAFRGSEVCSKQTANSTTPELVNIAPGDITEVAAQMGHAAWIAPLSGAGISGGGEPFAVSPWMVTMARTSGSTLERDNSGLLRVTVDGGAIVAAPIPAQQAVILFGRENRARREEPKTEHGVFGFKVPATMLRKAKTALDIAKGDSVGLSAGGDMFTEGREGLFHVADTGVEPHLAPVSPGAGWLTAISAITAAHKGLGDPRVDILGGATPLFRFAFDNNATLMVGRIVRYADAPVASDAPGDGWITLSQKQRALLKEVMGTRGVVQAEGPSILSGEGAEVVWTEAEHMALPGGSQRFHIGGGLLKAEAYRVGRDVVQAKVGARVVDIERSTYGDFGSLRCSLLAGEEHTVIHGTVGNASAFKYASSALSTDGQIPMIQGVRIEVGCDAPGTPVDKETVVAGTDRYRLHVGLLDVDRAGPSFTVPSSLASVLSTQEQWTLTSDGATVVVDVPALGARVIMPTLEKLHGGQYPRVLSLLALKDSRSWSFALSATHKQCADARSLSAGVVSVHANGAAWDAGGATSPQLVFSPMGASSKAGIDAPWFASINSVNLDALVSPLIPAGGALAFWVHGGNGAIVAAHSGNLLGIVQTERLSDDAEGRKRRARAAAAEDLFGKVETSVREQIVFGASSTAA